MRRTSSAIAALALSVLPLLSVGCGFGPSPQTADPDQARSTLHVVLDAWKAGARPESLQGQSPPIRVMDLDWSEGQQLLSYRADTEGRHVGYDMNYPVVLELRKRKGGTVKKTAVYTITTHPEILVMRQEG